MNKWYRWAVAVLLLSCNKAEKKATLYVPQPTVELAAVALDSAYEVAYKMINTGNDVLVVDTVTASCGCTVPASTRFVINPLDSAVLSVHFKPADTGLFDKKIVIKSNTDSSFTIVSFRGSAQK